MIDPKKVLIATPSHSGDVCCGYAGGLAEVFSSGFAGSITFLQGCADIGSARCQIVDAFKSSPFEWLVFWDSDIQAQARDFGLLMQVEPDPIIKITTGSDKEHDEVIHYSRINELMLAVGALSPELLVTAEYARKTETREPVRFGLGFTRIHKSVFKKLDDLVDDSGKELVDQFFHQGRLVREYFPMTTLGDGRRVGEDGGFWTLCRIAGLTPRVEQRTRLVHWGRHAYHYVSPSILTGQ